MFFRTKRLQCILPFAILLVVCWLTYWMVHVSTKPTNRNSSNLAPKHQINKENRFSDNGMNHKSPGLEENDFKKSVGEQNDKKDENEMEELFYDDDSKSKKKEEKLKEYGHPKESDVRKDVLANSELVATSVSVLENGDQAVQSRKEPVEEEDPNEYVVFSQDEGDQEPPKETFKLIPENLKRQEVKTDMSLSKNIENEVHKKFEADEKKVDTPKIEDSNSQQNPERKEPFFEDAVPIPVRSRTNILLEDEKQMDQPVTQQGQKMGFPDNLNQNNPANPPKDDDQSARYIMLHSGKASIVHSELLENLKTLPDYVPKEFYTFASDTFPTKKYLRPSIGNGILATVIHSPYVYMSGVYNGRLAASHRAAIPSTCSFNFTSTEPETLFKRSYILDVGSGIYSERSVGKTYNVTYRVYVHRSLTNIIAVEVDYERQAGSDPVKLKLSLNRWSSSYDYTFLKKESGREEVSYKVGTLNAKETEDASSAKLHVLYDHVPDELIAPPNSLRTKWVFLTAYGNNKEEVDMFYEEGVARIHGKDDLYASHVRAWSKIWAQGRIDIKGNLALAQAAYGSWYYMLSSIPLRSNMLFVGLSPSGLPFGNTEKDFQGRVLWDQEMWMFPPLLLFHQRNALKILESRRILQPGAYQNAQHSKVQGILFPYESGATGMELNEDINRGAKSPQVTAGVALALRQYLYATNQSQLVTNGTYHDLIDNICLFLQSRLLCTDDICNIPGTIPPDDSHGSVADSPFVNELVRLALSLVGYAYSLQNMIVERWTRFADKIVVPLVETTHMHMAYNGYTKKTQVKEADAILLGYPLLKNMYKEVRVNDLAYYESVLDPQTSPMTWAMHTISWLEVKERYRAESSFYRQMLFNRNAFQVWTNRTLGEPVASNYLSGMGAFLQTLINGYGGVRLRNDRLDLDPTLPLNATEMHFTGIDYLGTSLDIYISSNDVMIMATSRQLKAKPLVVYVYKTEEIYNLDVFKQYRFATQKAAIVPADAPRPVPV